MKSLEHMIAGAAAVLSIIQKDSEDNRTALHRPGVAIPIAAYCGKLPDMIEPSWKNPNHRQFFHSFAALGLLGGCVYKLYRWEPQDDVERQLRVLLLMAGVAYLSHLALMWKNIRENPKHL